MCEPKISTWDLVQFAQVSLAFYYKYVQNIDKTLKTHKMNTVQVKPNPEEK